MKVIKLAAIAVVAWMAFPASGQLREVQQTATFDAARLEQIVAPIALYPDSLLMQVFMAATYPLEVVEADRFARENPGMSQEALSGALAEKPWDPSVKALVGFPDVLKMSSDNLDWTRDLGDAFLAQRTELMDAVQRMRKRASTAGTLQTTPQEVVTTRDDGIVVVEPANPSAVYVPTYSPLSVYGGWSYPSWYYPRVYQYWPGSSVSFSFGSGYGDWLWGYPTWSWGGSGFFVDSNRYNWFNRRTGYHWSDRDVATGTRFPWTHSYDHRGGVRYRDPAVSRQYSGSDGWRRSREEARGFVPPPRVEPRLEPRPVPQRIQPTPSPRRIEPTPTGTPRIMTPRSQGPVPRTTPREPTTLRDQTPWKGSRDPSFDRQAIERGARSRGAPMQSPRGGSQSDGPNDGRKKP